MAGAGEAAIAAAASSEGFRPLQRLGVEAAVAGLTTPAELLRTLSIEDQAALV
jgi:type II secretory ATPase GspE/PulE/Tfp pilus assembly ATPase PilB-like protein